MKIDAIKNIRTNNNQSYHIQNTTQNRSQVNESGVYNPIYYKDYALNVSFKGGRDPKDFYEFNKDRMPATMNEYLNAKFEERSKLAPVQVLQEAYDDLHIATTVEDIKELYPNEPKFKDLKPANYAATKTGIMRKISEIKSMQDVPEPVFKDGTDDLTTYIVKKIYLEGKTVKEIDKDFAKDINPVYELAAKVSDDAKKSVGKNESVYFSNSTTQSLGIKFPNVAFWNSFIHTRDDYEQVKRVKTATGEFVNADSPEARAAKTTTKTEKPKAPNRYNFKKDSVKRVSDTIANAKGDPKEAMKELKRRGRDTEELTFVQKYWSQIMSVATEKVKLSEELIDFNATRENLPKVANDAVDRFINGIEFSKREKTPLQIFWNERTDLKGHFSNAISDTIVLFSENFGVDGNNDEFRNLMKYAENIRPTREAKKLEHDRIQAEYDQLAEELKAQDNLKSANETLVESAKQNLTTAQTQVAPKDLPVFEYNIDGEVLKLNFDVKKHAFSAYRHEFEMVPQRLVDTYMKELTLANGDDIKYWLTCCFDNDDIDPRIKGKLYDKEKLFEIHEKLITRMDENHNGLLESARISMLEYAHENGLLDEKEIQSLADKDILKVRNLVKERLTVPVEVASREIQSKFNEINKPLTSKERNGIRIDLYQYLKKGEFKPQQFPAEEKQVYDMLQLISKGIKEEPALATTFKNVLATEKLMQIEGSSLRYILKSDGNKTIRNIIRNHAISYMVKFFPKEVLTMYNYYPTEYLKIADAELARVGDYGKAITSMAKRLK